MVFELKVGVRLRIASNFTNHQTNELRPVGKALRFLHRKNTNK